MNLANLAVRRADCETASIAKTKKDKWNTSALLSELGRIISVANDTKLATIWIDLVNEVRDNLDLAPVKVEFTRFAGRGLDDLRPRLGHVVIFRNGVAVMPS